MEYAKDEVFNIKYLNEKITRKKGTSIIMSTIKENRFIQLIIGMTVVLSAANFIFIYNFFSILSKL